MGRALIFFFIVLCTCGAFAQSKLPEESRSDSTETSREAHSKPKILFGFDSRNSYALGAKAKMFGIRIGIEFREKHRVGFGLYDMIDYITLEDINSLHHKSVVDFSYASWFYEYIIFHNKKWDFGAPVFLGSGSAKIATYQSDGSVIYDSLGNNLSLQEESKFGIAGIGLNGHYKFRPWIGLGAGLGFRQVLSPEKTWRKDYNSPFYAIKLKIFMGELLKANPEKRAHRKQLRKAKKETAAE